MIGAYVAAALISASCLVVGRAFAATLGLSLPNGVLAGVGLAGSLVVAAAVVRLPGHGLAALTALAALLGLSWFVGRGRPWPKALPYVLVGLGVAGLCALPFAANRRFGLLGASIDDDLREHLPWAETLRTGDSLADAGVYPNYPLGAHSLSAAIAQLPGVDVASSLTGLMIASAVMAAWAGWSAIERGQAAVRSVAAVLVGLPYLSAAFFGWGAFKELITGVLLLTFVLLLRQLPLHPTPRLGVLLGLLAGASVLVNAYPTAAWFVGAAGAYLTAQLLLELRWPSRAELGAFPRWLVMVVGGFLAAVLPEIDRAVGFVPPLAGGFREHISPAEITGAWFSSDLRFAPPDSVLREAPTWLALAAAGYAVVWWVRRRDLAVPAALLAGGVIYVFARSTTIGYVTAKTLAVVAPLFMLFLVRPLVETASPRSRSPLASRVVRLGVACAFLLPAVWSSALVLRYSPVSSEARTDELAGIRAIVADRPVLFLGEDHFIHWKLRGSLSAAFNLTSDVFFTANPEKPFAGGTPADFDSVSAKELARFDFALSTSSSFASSPPSNWHAVRRTPSYILWRRTGAPVPRRVLQETGVFGAVLNCHEGAMATLSRKRGAAGTRFEPLVVPGGWIPLGTTATIPVALPRGVWELSIQYRSPVELKLRAPGLRRTVLPNLDVPGPLWRVGVVTASGTVKVSIDVPGTWLARKRLALVSSLAFVRADDRLRVLPLRESCGKFVDWYRIDGEASSDGRTS